MKTYNGQIQCSHGVFPDLKMNGKVLSFGPPCMVQSPVEIWVTAIMS